MIRLVWHYLKAFLFDENTALRAVYALSGILATTLATVLAFGVDTVLAWTPHETMKHAVVALVGAITAALPGAPIAKPAPQVEPGQG